MGNFIRTESYDPRELVRINRTVGSFRVLEKTEIIPNRRDIVPITWLDSATRDYRPARNYAGNYYYMSLLLGRTEIISTRCPIAPFTGFGYSTYDFRPTKIAPEVTTIGCFLFGENSNHLNTLCLSAFAWLDSATCDYRSAKNPHGNYYCMVATGLQKSG